MRCEPYKNLLLYEDDIKNFYNYSDDVETFLPKMLESKNFCIFRNKCPNLLLDFKDDKQMSNISFLDFGIHKIPIQYNVSNEIKNIFVDEIIDKIENKTITELERRFFLSTIQKVNQSDYFNTFIGDKMTLDRVINAIIFKEIDSPDRDINKKIKILEMLEQTKNLSRIIKKKKNNNYGLFM